MVAHNSKSDLPLEMFIIIILAVNNSSTESKKIQAAINMAVVTKYATRFQSCPSCRKPTPRCSICLMNMGSNSGFFAGMSHMMPSNGKDGATVSTNNGGGKKSEITPFGMFFTWCQVCRHGGHADHIEGN